MVKNNNLHEGTKINARRFIDESLDTKKVKSVTYKFQKGNDTDVYLDIKLKNGESKKGFYTDKSNKTSFIN